MKKNIYFLILVLFSFSGSKIYGQSGVGLWDDQGYGSESYTTYDLGVGITPPDGKAEIYYEEATINGLVVTRYDIVNDVFDDNDLDIISSKIGSFIDAGNSLSDDELSILGDDFSDLLEDMNSLMQRIDEREATLEELIDLQENLIALQEQTSYYPDYFSDLNAQIEGLLEELTDEKLGTSNITSSMPDLQIDPFNTSDKPLFLGRVKTLYQGQALPQTTNPSIKTKMMLTSDGEVGINTENPRVTLDVIGKNGTNIPTAIFGLLRSNDYTRHIQVNNMLMTNGLSQLSVIGDQGIFWTDAVGTNGTNSNSGFVLAPLDGSTNGLKIDKDGNVGIGIQQPNHTLSVNGNIFMTGSSSSLLFGDNLTPDWGEWGIEYQDGGLNFWKPYGSNNFGNYYLFLKDNGNIGIGLSSPQAKLDIEQSSNDYPALNVVNSGGTGEGVCIVSGAGTSSASEHAIFKVSRYSGAGSGSLDLFEVEGKTGQTRARELVVNMDTWPDYVFDGNYNLISLKYLEKYIDEHKHLPNVPSENEIIKDGINVGQMNATLLQKIEELTLYIIDQNKRIEELEKAVKNSQK